MHHLAHHPKIVAGGQVFGADVELSIVVLRKALRPRDDHRADRVRAHDVAVVVDLDAARRLRQSEHFGKARQELRLRRRVGKSARERLARIGERVLDQVALFAPLRHRDLNAMSGALAERRREKLALLEIVRDEDQPRHRLVVIELREKGLQHGRRVEALVGLWKVGAVPPILSGAEEEYLDRGETAVLVDREDVGLLDAVRIDALMRLDVGERGEPVAVERRGLEIEVVRCCFHRARKLRLHLLARAGKKCVRLRDEAIVVVERDLARARRRAALDLIKQARPRAACVDGVRAGADQKRLLQRVDRAADRAGRCERSEVAALPPPRAAMLHDRRRFVILGDQDVGKRFVVAEIDVEARPEALDQVRFEKQRLRLGPRAHESHGRGGADHAGDAAALPGDAGVADDPLLQAPRLADIEHVAVAIDHPVDAGCVRQRLHRRDDHRFAGFGRLGRLPIEVERRHQLRTDILRQRRDVGGGGAPALAQFSGRVWVRGHLRQSYSKPIMTVVAALFGRDKPDPRPKKRRPTEEIGDGASQFSSQRSLTNMATRPD